jgi:LysR family transcriptional regulator, low CO2-responsive transcriptional regulator
MLQTESDIDFSLRNNGELRGGNLRVGTTGPYYILPAIAAFHRQYPAVELCVEVANSRQVLDALIDSRLDLAVSSRLVDDSRLVRITIANDALVVISHRDHPLAREPKVRPSQLAAHTLLLRERGSRTREIIEDTLRHYDVRPATLIEIGSREAIYEAMHHNMGFTLMPIGEAPDHPDLRKSEFERDAPTIQEYLYHLQTRSDTRLIKAFLAYVEDRSDATQNG